MAIVLGFTCAESMAKSLTDLISTPLYSGMTFQINTSLDGQKVEVSFIDLENSKNYGTMVFQVWDKLPLNQLPI